MNIVRLTLVALTTCLLAACTTTGSTTAPASVIATKKIAAATSPIVQVRGPYEEAKACIARIPDINQLNVGVGPITDKTGKVNMAEGGTGSFISQGMTDAFFNSLFGLGVSVTDLTLEQQNDVKFISSAGVGGKMRTPSFVIRGGVTALDFSQESNVGELSVYGVGPKARAYNSTGRMDVRLVAMPGGKIPANVTVAVSSPFKQFLAVEREVGFASFVGAGTGLTFASFRIGGGLREPMQHTMGFMADYAVGDLVLKYIGSYGTEAQKASAPACRELLEWSPKPAQVASTAA